MLRQPQAAAQLIIFLLRCHVACLTSMALVEADFDPVEDADETSALLQLYLNRHLDTEPNADSLLKLSLTNPQAAPWPNDPEGYAKKQKNSEEVAEAKSSAIYKKEEVEADKFYSEDYPFITGDNPQAELDNFTRYRKLNLNEKVPLNRQINGGAINATQVKNEAETAVAKVEGEAAAINKDKAKKEAEKKAEKVNGTGKATDAAAGNKTSKANTTSNATAASNKTVKANATGKAKAEKTSKGQNTGKSTDAAASGAAEKTSKVQKASKATEAAANKSII